jgi:hypothetical protein
MELTKISESGIESKAEGKKRLYNAPVLRSYGSVKNLTRSGTGIPREGVTSTGLCATDASKRVCNT